jgi:hypothetical protein
LSYIQSRFARNYVGGGTGFETAATRRLYGYGHRFGAFWMTEPPQHDPVKEAQ